MSMQHAHTRWITCVMLHYTRMHDVHVFLPSAQRRTPCFPPGLQRGVCPDVRHAMPTHQQSQLSHHRQLMGQLAGREQRSPMGGAGS